MALPLVGLEQLPQRLSLQLKILHSDYREREALQDTRIHRARTGSEQRAQKGGFIFGAISI